MNKVTPSINRGSVSQKNHHNGQFRGSQSQGHHSSKPLLGIKGGGGGIPSPLEKINNSLVSIPKRISQGTKCHQNKGKRVPTVHRFLFYSLLACYDQQFQRGTVILAYTRMGDFNNRCYYSPDYFRRMYWVHLPTVWPGGIPTKRQIKRPHEYSWWGNIYPPG